MIKHGQKFNKLTAISFHHTTSKNNFWLFQCDCGVRKIYPRSYVVSGKYKSCGCYKKNLIAVLSTKHGDAKRGKTTRLFSIWQGMHRRCSDKNIKAYAYYGARGISVCSEWKSFIEFKMWALKNGYTDHLTIERKNVNGNYEPLNCCWISLEKQASNKSNSRVIEYNGQIKHAAAWAKEAGIAYKTFHKRLQSGYPMGEALKPDPIIKDGAKSFSIEYPNGDIIKYKSGNEFTRLTNFDSTTISSARKRNVKSYKFKQGKVKGLIVHFELVGQP